jgi:predicted ATP-grasp superfamily ATP-dependent carboligase
MTRKHIEEGHSYSGPSGQIRRLVKLQDGMATFEVIDRGFISGVHTAVPKLGERRTIRAKGFAAWALQEVEPI